jgi:diguanylate cyclase (GGDEF)-like protein
MQRRRESDKHPLKTKAWRPALLASPVSLRAVTWDDQRSQFITRYIFCVLGLAYFNLGGTVARSAEFLLAVNVMHVVYASLTTIYLVHARNNRLSPLRWRLAMWTDLVGCGFAALADSHVTSPAYLVFLAIIIGNGMRYGLRPFAEAALGSFLLVMLILYLQFTDYMSAMSVAGIFFFLFGAIFVLYAFSLMARLERRREEMVAQSGLDQLTGLLNRRGFEERATRLFLDVQTQGRPLSVMFADLDGFKGINDAMGHHVGDTVLRKIAGLINSSIRDSDVAARYGGDEFVVIMPDTGLSQATQVAERLQEAVGQWARSGNIALSLSIGMGEAPSHGNELEQLLQRVDSAMYLNKQARARGGIRCVDDVPD